MMKWIFCLFFCLGLTVANAGQMDSYDARVDALDVSTDLVVKEKMNSDGFLGLFVDGKVSPTVLFLLGGALLGIVGLMRMRH